MIFKVGNVREFIEAYRTVFSTTQIVDRLRRDYCLMEVAEGKVYFYRYDGAVYTEAWCEAQVSEGGKVIVSSEGFANLPFCEGQLKVTVDDRSEQFKILMTHSRGETKVNSVNESLDVFHRFSPTRLFSKFPVDPRSFLWAEGQDLKIGGRYMECNVETIKTCYYVHPSPILEQIVFFPTDRASLLKEDSQVSYDTGVIWIRNGNAIHRVSGKSDVFQDEKKSFLAPYFQEIPITARFTVKSDDLRDGMAYAKTITVGPERHQGICSIRYCNDGVLHIENMWSERMQQEATYIPLAKGERMGQFDISVVPGQLVACLDALKSETIKVETIATALRFTAENGVCGAVAFAGDNWRKKNEQ